MSSNCPMTHCKRAPKERVQAAGGDTCRDAGLAEAKRPQLTSRNDALLSICDPGNFVIDASGVLFALHTG